MADDTMQALLQQPMSDSSVAVKHRDLQWSWAQYLTKSAARAAALLAAADPQRPMHIGALLGNTPEMLTQKAAAGAPIERLLLQHSAINRVAVYAVPDERVGDQVMAAIVLNEGLTLDPDSFETFLEAQPDLSPKARPRYVRIAADLPSTATHKVLKRQLITQGTAIAEGETLWEREPRGTAYRAVSRADAPSPWVPDGGSAPSTVAPA
jgi:AMP-binding enzyme C-terminal domain